MNPILEVQAHGQSIWYDNIRRGLILSGELAGMVERDGVLGVTSNPAIFEKAIAGSTDYDQALKALVAQGVGTAQELYERLATEDIQLAADVLYPVYARTRGRDGYVSFEVSPYLADDTRGTVQEARRLFAAVGRDNVMIKVPATPAGIPAVRDLIAAGINVNVTLLFAVEAYEAVADAYLAGLEAVAARGGDLGKVASVASFFVSRVDTLIDERIAGPGGVLEQIRDRAQRARLEGILGKVAIANARLAYARYRDLRGTRRFQELAARGAMPQRLLWASTGTKNPKYSPTLYVDALIGPDTVNTVPAETYAAFQKSTEVRPRLTEGWSERLEEAREVLATLAEAGISLKEATDTLLADAVKKFSDPFDKLLAAIEKKRQALLGGGTLDAQTVALGGGAASEAVANGLEDWRTHGKVRRLWAGDGHLWTGADESQWLGWLHVVDGHHEHADAFRRLAESGRGFANVVVLGMGGSSLCPDVLCRTFGVQAGFPELLVLDSTVPAQVRATAARIDPARTLFVVSSKSGTTIEPNVFAQYFRDRVTAAVGAAAAGRHFVAITDPDTKLEALARAQGFRHVAHGVPSIGGRFSALSNFGMVPAALMGLDVSRFLDVAEVMVHACASCVPPELNPGVRLGVVLGALARQGRDKVTLVASPRIAALGGWLEQLIAESTGKQGRGLVPVDGEPIGRPEVYGQDRVFAYLRLASEPSSEQDQAVAALERAGQPLVRIELAEPMELGQEFFRWEMATAVAGSILGINAFDQPDVEAAKVAARRLTAAYEAEGRLPAEAAVLEDAGLRLFADARNAAALSAAAGGARDAAGYLTAHLGRLQSGDYFAITAYVEMTEAHDRELQAIRRAVRDAKRVATTVGYGPRFLHSTGQLHKGGPNTGVFLQITADPGEDVPIPGQRFGFGVLAEAQAQGDFQVLAERGRRILRVHLDRDVAASLARLRALVGAALAG